MIEFKLPDIGEGTVEGEIVRWLVKPGDRVRADQPVVEVMTDKATVELTAPRAGTVVELRAEAGKVARVGSVIYLLDDSASFDSAPAAPALRSGRADGGAVAAPVLSAGRADGGAVAVPVLFAGRADGGVAVAVRPVHPERSGREAAVESKDEPEAPARKPLATPATRKLARELGVDLAAVFGTGPAGRITDADVRNAAAGPGRAPAPALAPAAAAAPTPSSTSTVRHIAGAEEVERIPFRGVRKAIAAQMTRSKFTATHYTYVEEVDMTEVVRFRESVKDEAKARGVKLTYLPFIARAVCAALKKHPMLNSELDEKGQEIVLKKYYHLGFSIQADAGLSVGVVRHADRRSLYDLAQELERLVGAVRAGKAKPEDLKGSTFTITSAGNIGGVFATPIINFPEVAILGVNQIKKRAVVRTSAEGEDEIVVRHMMFLSISLDHRVVDGAVAARFVNDVVYLLEDPRRMLLEA